MAERVVICGRCEAEMKTIVGCPWHLENERYNELKIKLRRVCPRCHNEIREYGPDDKPFWGKIRKSKA